jgi:hypothetical protein
MTSKRVKPKKTDKESKPPKEIIIDFDSNWKYLIIKYFFQFIAFFIPELFADIDTTRAPVFLDNELQTIWRSMKTGLKMTDKLVQVWLKNGDERLILIHIEIQARFETLFSKRMFTISYRVLDKYQVQPIALAVFVDTPVPTQFNTYEDKIYGTETRYKYNAYKIIDQIETELLKSDNLFALVVLANLRTIQTKKKDEEIDRLSFKKHLYNLVIERNFEPEIYYDLLGFIDYLMVLPENLAMEYEDFSSQATKKTINMEKLKVGPRMKNLADAIYLGAYGVDIAAERQAAKRQIQIEKRKSREADAKSREADAKSKELITKLVLVLRFSQTVEQISAIAGISVSEVNAILDAHPV